MGAALVERRGRHRRPIWLIERGKRTVLYTNFQDEIGQGEEIVFEKFVSNDEFRRFRERACDFLRAHENHIAIHKLRHNAPLTPTGLGELERMLLESGTGSAAEIEKAKTGSEGLGLFVRLNRAAAKEAFAGFLQGKTLSANQIEFVGMIIDNLAESGWIDPARLYEAPYTRFSARGVDGLFLDPDIVSLLDILDTVRQCTVA